MVLLLHYFIKDSHLSSYNSNIYKIIIIIKIMNFIIIQLVNDEDIPGVLDAKMTFETNLYPSIKYIVHIQ